MEGIVLIVVTYILVAIIVIVVALNLIKRNKLKKTRLEITELDKQKNILDSMPIDIELIKIEPIIKNDMMEEKYKIWQDRYENIKEVRIPLLTDKIIDLDIFVDSRDYKRYIVEQADVEIELFKTRQAIDNLLAEINELNSSEEKYRSIITKLKAKYRELNSTFGENKDNYLDIADIILLQFENIEKRFQDFEELMEKSEYTEVVHIVKAIDTMIDHMSIVVAEVPDLVLLAEKLIPKKIELINESYEDLVEKHFPVSYMNIEYNIEEALKNTNKILDRIKVLNLEECMFELKTMLEYLDSLFSEFEIERNARKVYEEENPVFETKINKTNKIVSDVYNQLDEIKNMYDLTDEDIKIIDDVAKNLEVINKDYKKIGKTVTKKDTPYSAVMKSLEELTNRLVELEENLDVSLKSLGNMYDDEVRAREQLDEIQELLNQSKIRIRGYKLPIISNDYFVQLSEANEAILEIIKELEKKPISIKILNTRVDTARDLVLKLYNTTNEMIKTARLVEDAIIYGNSFRTEDNKIDYELSQAELLFYKGNYKRALDVSFEALDKFDSDIKVRLMQSYSSDK